MISGIKALKSENLKDFESDPLLVSGGKVSMSTKGNIQIKRIADATIVRR